MSWLSDLLTGNSSDKRAAERAKKTQEEQKANLLRVSKQAIQTGTPQQQQKAQRILTNKSWSVDNSYKPAYNNDPLKNATGQVGLGLYRSAIGTGQGLSGIYDLATPGKGTNRLSKALDVKAKRADEIAVQQNKNGIGYKGGQFLGDALTFTGGAPVIKGASTVLGTGAKMIPGASKVIAPTTNLVSKVSKPLTAVSTPVSKGIATTTAKLANNGAGGRIAAQAIQTGASKSQLMNTGVDMGLGLGQMASKGQDIGWKDVALQGGISAGFGVGLPATAQAVKEVIQPTTKLVTGMARGARSINTPPNINNPLAPKMVTPDGQIVSIPKNTPENNISSKYIVNNPDGSKYTKGEHHPDFATNDLTKLQRNAKQYNRNLYDENIPIARLDGQDVNVLRESGGKWGYFNPERTTNKQLTVDKLKMTPHQGEMIKATKWQTDKSGNPIMIQNKDLNNHPDVAYWTYGTTKYEPVQSSTRYEGVVNLGYDKDFKPVYYTIDKIKESALPARQVKNYGANSNNSSIPNKNNPVNPIRGLEKLKDLDKKLGQKGSVRNPLVNPDGTPKIGKAPKTEGVVPDPLEALKAEARKYKSAEEFVKSQANLMHGTKADFTEFDPSLLGTNTGAPSAKKGFFFTDTPEIANHYANPGRNYGTAISKNLEDAFSRISNRAKAEGLDNSLSNNNGAAMIVGSWPKVIPGTPKESVIKAVIDKMDNLKARFDSPSDIAKIERYKQLAQEELSNTRITELEMFGKVMKSKVDFKNPLVIDDRGFRNGASYAQRIDEAVAKGHDGVVIKNTQDPLRGNIYVALNKDQILTEKQLTDLYNQATKEATPPKPVAPKTEGVVPKTPPVEKTPKQWFNNQQISDIDKKFQQTNPEEHAKRGGITQISPSDGSDALWNVTFKDGSTIDNVTIPALPDTPVAPVAKTTPTISKTETVAPVEKTSPFEKVLPQATQKPKAEKLAPKPLRTVYDTDKIYQSSSKAKKEVVDAAVAEEVMKRKEEFSLWKQLHEDIKSYGGINNKADEFQGGFRKNTGVAFNKGGGQNLDEITQELSSTGKYGTLTPEQLLDLYANKPSVGKVSDIKNQIINELEDGKNQYSDYYKNIQKDLDKRTLELQDVPVTAKIVDKPDAKMTDAEWRSLQETAPMEAKTTKQAIGGELASVRKELEASKKLAAQLQERQKMEVIQGKTNVANKMRESNATIYEDIKKLQAREKELAKQYSQEMPPDNRVDMSDPKNVDLDGINEAYNSSLKDKTKKQMFKDLSRKYLGDVEAAKITADKKALDFTAKHQLNDAERLEVIQAADNPTIKTNNPKVKAAVDDLHKNYDDLYNYFTKEKGVDMGYQHDYYPREYINTKTGDQMTAAEYDLLQRASTRTKGRTSDALADWKLKYTDPAEGLKSYYSNLEKAAAGRKYMQELENQGLVVKGDGAPMQGYQPIVAEGIQPSSGGVYYAKKEVANKLNTMFGSKEATDILEKALEKGEGLNSFWQSVVLSGGIPNTPINAFGFMQVMKESMALHPVKAAKAMWGGVNKGFSQKFFETKADTMTLMAKEGIPIRYSLSEGAKKGIGRTKAAFDESKARGINQAWNEITNDATFGRFMPILEVQHFDNVYKHGLKKGLSPEKAAKIAGDSTKNFYGITDLYSKTTRPKKVDSATGTFLFAPRFRESMLNFWGKNAKALGVSDGKLNITKPEYRDNAKFMLAAGLMFAAYDGLNKELNGTHLWENPDGKKDKLLIPNATGDGKTIGVPFLPSIATVPRNAGMFAFNAVTGNFGEAGKNFASFLSMPVRTAGELLLNENYFGQPIVDKDASAPERLTQGASHVAKSTLQPWLREGLNVAGQGLPEGVKDALGIKKKSVFETASNALEAPLRFYNPDNMRGGGDNFRQANGKTNAQIKAEKGAKMTLEESKVYTKKRIENAFGKEYADMSQEDLKAIANTDSNAAEALQMYDSNKGAFGAGPKLPESLKSEPARKVLDRAYRTTTEDWGNQKNTIKEVNDSLKSWNNGKDLPEITNEVAKDWAEYQKDFAEGKISKMKADDKKKSILKKAYNSQLNEDEREIYKFSEADIKDGLSRGLLTEENVKKALAIEKQLFDAKLITKETLAKKLDQPARGYKTSSRTKRSSSRSRSTRRSSGGSSSVFTPIPQSAYSMSGIYSQVSSKQKKLRDLLQAAKV